MPDLSEYKIDFHRNSLLGTWSYVITTPDGEELHPIMGIFVDQENVEKAALRQIEIHKGKYTLTGDKLKEKINAQSG